ncbi:MAG: MlaD family protein [Actinomycetota bacterium]|nr:MlaD family protein [Actinomycetota bacterium]
MRRGQRQRISRVQAGLILVVLAVLITYFGFTKAIPFQHHFEIKAQFADATNLRKGSFVRIGGVNVGRVTSIDPLGHDQTGAVATLRIDDVGRPIHKDATLRIRPNIFLEGNTFVDVKPGTPSAATLGDGDTIAARQTSTYVSIGQILTALQADDRHNLQILLQELSKGLSDGGGLGYNRSIQYWKDAFEGSAVVNDASTGILPHDLSNYIKQSGTVAGALDANPEALKSFITDFNTTAAAFAREQGNLEQTVAELPRTLRAAQPALAALNAAFPPLRRLVVDFRPAVRSSGPAIDASLPFVRQARGLVSRRELRGLVADLRPLVPDLARLSNNSVPLYQQVRLASSCQNNVILPWSNQTVPDPNFPSRGPVYQEGVKGLPGLAQESRAGDANGQWARVIASNGVTTYALGQDAGGALRVGHTNFPILGVNPPKATRPPSRYDVPCETQQPADLRTIPGQPPQQVSSTGWDPKMSKLNEANQLEGIAASLTNEGHAQRADQFYAKAKDVRQANGLVGKQFDIVNGQLSIVEPSAGAATKLTKSGAPLVAPFQARAKKTGYEAALRGATAPSAGKPAGSGQAGNAGPLVSAGLFGGGVGG